MPEDSGSAVRRSPDFHPIGTLNTHDGQPFGTSGVVIGDILAVGVDRDLITIGDGVTDHPPWRRLTRRQLRRHLAHLLDALDAAEEWHEDHPDEVSGNGE